MILGLLVLVTFQILGEFLASWWHLPVPGAVLGLLLLLTSLRFLPWHERLLAPTHKATGALIDNLSLLFLPAGVGIFFLPERINAQWPAVIAAMVGGTLVAMLLTSLLYRALSQRPKSHE